MLIDDPFSGCFLCEPEPWRVVFRGNRVRALAGFGPLVPGYIIVAPIAHVPTVAELNDVSFAEFVTVFDILVDSLHRQFGPGYTAYEHGRIGSCLVAEMRGDVSTFCYHAHRVI